MSPSFKQGLACRTKVTHPVDFSECRYQPPLSVIFNQRHRRGARQAAFATAHREQGHIALLQTGTQQSRREDVSKTDEVRNLIRLCHITLLSKHFPAIWLVVQPDRNKKNLLPGRKVNIEQALDQ